MSITPLAPCSGVTGDWSETYGSHVTKNVDVNIYYIGRNGGYTSTDQLVKQNEAMVNFAGTSKYIVLGFHESYSQIHAARPAVEDSYVTKMANAFGSHFLNLNAEINSRTAELLVLTGVYSSISAFNDDTSTAAINDKITLQMARFQNLSSRMMDITLTLRAHRLLQFSSTTRWSS